jgi:hypothetical protein
MRFSRFYRLLKETDLGKVHEEDNEDPVEILDIQPYTERNDKYWILEVRFLKSGEIKRILYDLHEYRKFVKINSKL